MRATGKLRLTTTASGSACQKELGAAFRQLNPDTPFRLDQPCRWMQGNALPPSVQLHEDWVVVLGLDQPGV
jgi:hypothetical protein